jgi:apolipoprotein N-acyltransferase
VKLSRINSIIILFLGGLLCAISFAPYDFLIGAMVGFLPLLWVEESISQHGKYKNWRMFTSAYFFYAVFNFIGIWWISNAAWIAVITSVVLNSFFFSLTALFYHGVKKRLGAKAGYISFITLFIAWEYVELLDWDFSWPWLTLGHSLANWPKLMQWYSFTGVLGGSFWLVLINLYLFFALKVRLEIKESFLAFKKLLTAIYFVFIPIIISLIQFYSYEEIGGEIDVVVLQPNMDPYLNDRFINDNGFRQQYYASEIHVKKMLEMASSKMDKDVDFLLMHETALPATESNITLGTSADVALVKVWRKQYPKLNILTGLAYQDYKKAEVLVSNVPSTYKVDYRNGLFFEYFNSSILINSCDTLAQYHKSKLVLGVERIPDYLIYFQKYAQDFDTNPNARIYNPNNGIQAERSVFKSANDSISIAPIICYESVFGEYVNEYVQNGANVLGVITNDAWWGNTAGHQQHWSFSKIRAVETRRSVARSANTGWSGFINQKGLEIERSEYLQPAVLRAKLKLNDDITFYVKYGDVLGKWCLVLALIILLNLLVVKFKKEGVNTF